jgi:uncharacterized membrane protein (DUF373 family)
VSHVVALLRYLRGIERAVIIAVVVMMTVVLAFSTLDLAWTIVRDLASPPPLLLDVSELLDIFGFFLLIIVGIELLETIRAYLEHRVIRAEVVIEVAIIAVVRKVIILEIKDLPSLTLVGIGVIVIALGAAFYLLKHSRQPVSRRGEPTHTGGDQ